jgi:hypothetical protein
MLYKTVCPVLIEKISLLGNLPVIDVASSTKIIVGEFDSSKNCQTI